MAFFMYGGDAQYNLNPAGFGADRGLMVSNIGPGKGVQFISLDLPIGIVKNYFMADYIRTLSIWIMPQFLNVKKQIGEQRFICSGRWGPDAWP